MIKKVVAVAAILVLMLCSVIVGSMAFGRGVPVEQETAEFDEIGLALILSVDWKGKCAVEK